MNLKDTYARICAHRYRELDDSVATRAGQDLVKWLLQPNPDLRPSLEVVKNHSYLSKEFSPATLPDSCCYMAPTCLLPTYAKTSPTARADAFNNNANINGQPIIPNNMHWQQPPSIVTPKIPSPSGHPRHYQQHHYHPQQPQQIPALQQQSEKPSSAIKGKKKVSSWLAGLKLPKLPKFRQRISSVLCLEAKKKHIATPVGPGEYSTSAAKNCCESPALQMSLALEECLAKTKINWGNVPRVDNRVPLFVTKWIDYSNKHGLAFQLSDNSVGVLFNDSTKMSYTHDRR